MRTDDLMLPAERPAAPSSTALPLVDFGHASQPCDGETECGDLVAGWPLGNGAWLLVLTDGLGHGPHARAASQSVIDTLALTGAAAQTLAPPDLLACMQRCDRALRRSRGAAVALVHVDTAARRLSHVGVGNVGVLVSSRGKRRLAGTPGIVGAGLPPLRVDQVALAGAGVLALFSDGVDVLFDREQPQALAGSAPSAALAADLVQRWRLPHDDAAMALLRWGPPAVLRHSLTEGPP